MFLSLRILTLVIKCNCGLLCVIMERFAVGTVGTVGCEPTAVNDGLISDLFLEKKPRFMRPSQYWN